MEDSRKAHATKSRTHRMRLVGVCVVASVIGVASKFYTGPGQGVAVGQFEDFFGTLFLVLFARLCFPRRPIWLLASGVLFIVTAIEFSQLLHGGLIERVRATWLGAHIIGTDFEWADLLAYLLATLTALVIDRRGPCQPVQTR